MKKIKIITDAKRSMQKQIDTWIEEENPIVLSTSISCAGLQTGGVACVISILYEENREEQK